MLLKMFVKDTFFAWNTPFFDNIIYYRHTLTLDVVNELTIAEFPKHQFGRFFFSGEKLAYFPRKKRKKKYHRGTHPLWWKRKEQWNAPNERNISRLLGTVCPSSSSDPFYVVTFYIKWVTTSWTYSSSHSIEFCVYFCVSMRGKNHSILE